MKQKDNTNMVHLTSVSLVIPVYNNEKTIVHQINTLENLLSGLCRQYEIIISDDKSWDTTAKIMKKHYSHKKYIQLIFNKTNLGIAKNIHQLYTLAQYEYVALFSVDGGWKPQDVMQILQCAYDNNADIVIGKRDKKNYSLYRRFISFCYNFLPLVLYGVHTVDAGSIKVFKRSLFHNMHFVSKGVFFEAEMIIKAKKMGRTIMSVPVTYITHHKHPRDGAKLSLVIQAIKDMMLLKINGV